ncbi:MAG: hypothetical protein RQM92_12655 [Candidatus Syntrophopropionicum ammoniitolerans]
MRTQKGNNNAYCQDNETSYLDWSLADTHQQMIDYVRKMIALRMRFPHFHQEKFFSGRDSNLDTIRDINWYAADLGPPDWHKQGKGFLAFLIQGSELKEVTARERNGMYW